MKIPEKAKLMAIAKPIEPVHWSEHGLTVIGDGYLNDGTRVHLVKEKLTSEPVLLNNAWVVSAA